MLLTNTRAASQPAKVTIENIEGKKRVVLTDHIEYVSTPEEGSGYSYDEVIFFLPEDRNDTLYDIELNFDAWWEYGQIENEPLTLEQRVAELEGLIMDILS